MTTTVTIALLWAALGTLSLAFTFWIDEHPFTPRKIATAYVLGPIAIVVGGVVVLWAKVARP